MAKSIDQKTHALYKYIKEFQLKHGFSPTVREMCKAMNLNSTSTVSYYLSHLEREGMIKRNQFKNRAIEIVHPTEPSVLESLELIRNYCPIPLVGNITAGEPILAVENYEEVFYMPAGLFRGDDLFMLTVRGDSMINAGIMSGDKVIIKKQETADDGDIVAAMIDDSATVKRFFKETDRIRLQPENPTMSPIYAEDVKILGKVVGLIRSM